MESMKQQDPNHEYSNAIQDVEKIWKLAAEGDWYAHPVLKDIWIIAGQIIQGVKIEPDASRLRREDSS